MDDLFYRLGETFGFSSVAAAVFTSFGMSTCLYLLSGVVSRLVSKTYNNLSLRDQLRWNAGINRSIIGIIFAFLGIKTLLLGFPEDNPALAAPDHLLHTAGFALGFFIFETRDSLNMFFAHNVVEETLVVHHVLGILLYVITLTTRSYLYPACLVLVEEIHAPFTHAGWILAKLRLDKHWIWEANQYCLISVWIVFRNGCDLVIWLHILSNLWHGFLSGPLLSLLYVLGGIVLLSVYLNPYWLGIKFQQLRRRNERCKKQVT